MTLVFDALVQPQREVGEHLLTHSVRYGAQFRLNYIVQLRNISWLVDVHFSFEVSPQKKSPVDRSGEQAGHGTTPLWERSFPGNNLRNTAIASLASKFSGVLTVCLDTPCFFVAEAVVRTLCTQRSIVFRDGILP